ncbi:MAG: type II toxin-antitoxin system VapC family toxin [Rickettsiaceae bacterium]|nr:type II toxin-antitoxin system VapC family toxin [Rickettsiaceae bacterium]
MNKKVVFDASALLILLQKESGSEKLRPLLDYAVMSTVNISEVLNVLGRNNLSAEESIPLINDMITEIIPFDIDQAELSAKLSLDTSIQGLSLGDRACIALGMQMKLPIYTADQLWGKVKLPNANIILAR